MSKRRRLGPEHSLRRSANTGSASSASRSSASAGSPSSTQQAGFRGCLVKGDVVILPDRRLTPGYVYVNSNGNIAYVGSRKPSFPLVDAMAKEYSAGYVLPGMVDIHNHGLGGHDDVVGYWSNAEYSLQRLAKQGTTSCLATIVFKTGDDISGLCNSISNVCGKTGLGCVLRGIHAEGPIIATLGGLPDSSDFERGPGGFEDILTTIGPWLKIMTISPSIDALESFSRIKLLVKHGVRVSLGHDKQCSEAQILRALHVAKTVNQRFHITHAFNVQSFHHRNPGLANFALCKSFPSNLPNYAGLTAPTVEVICDFMHVSPLTLSILLAARPAEDVCVITDAISEPVPGKRVRYSSSRIAEVSSDAKTVSTLEGVLCGSCTSLLASLRRLVFNLQQSLVDACKMCATTPAKVAGIDDLVGSIKVGKRGDLLLFGLENENGSASQTKTTTGDQQYESLPELECTLVGGEVAWML